MSNPFEAQQNFGQQMPAQGQPFGAAPTQGQPAGNPFGQPVQSQAPAAGGFGQPAGNPFGQGQPPAQQGQPMPGQQFGGQQMPAQGQTPGYGGPAAGGDPFGQVPESPSGDVAGLDQNDAAQGSIVILYPTKFETNVLSKYPDDKTGQPQYFDRLTANVIVVSGPKAGQRLPDVHIRWARVAKQFAERVGDGQPYLVQLGKDGNAVVASPVTDPAARQYAATLLG